MISPVQYLFSNRLPGTLMPLLFTALLPATLFPWFIISVIVTAAFICRPGRLAAARITGSRTITSQSIAG